MIFGFICLLIGFYLGVAFTAIMSIAKEKKKEKRKEKRKQSKSKAGQFVRSQRR